MSSRLGEIFEDDELVQRIKGRLPYLFQIAELESSRAGKTGMQVGSLRETILAALLIYRFGEGNVETEIPITEPEIDVRLFGQAISIKTITSKKLGGVKLSWTVDPHKAKEYRERYHPASDILLAQVNWGATGGLYHIPLEAQVRVFVRLGRETYIKLPKPGTNPRGVEITEEALSEAARETESKVIEIHWKRAKVDYDAHKRWVDFWRTEDLNATQE